MSQGLGPRQQLEVVKWIGWWGHLHAEEGHKGTQKAHFPVVRTLDGTKKVPVYKEGCPRE